MHLFTDPRPALGSPLSALTLSAGRSARQASRGSQAKAQLREESKEPSGSQWLAACKCQTEASR